MAFAALRKQDPDRKRPYRLPAGALLAPIAFVAANFVVSFAGWKTNYKVFIAVLAGFVFLALSYTFNREGKPPLDWRPAVWLWPYLGGLALLSYLGSFDGEAVLPFGIDLLAIAVFSLAIFFFAQSVRLPAERAQANVEEAVEHEVESDEKAEQTSG